MNQNISLIIPTFNRASLLKEALDSVYAQTMPLNEIIVIDDGSEDNTSEICRNYHKLRYIQQSNQGVSAARNHGIQISNGDWICFLDSDDVWTKHKLEKQWLAHLDQPQYKISYTNEKWIRNGSFFNQGKKHQKHSGWIFSQCLPLCIISPSSVLIHRDVFTKIGAFDTNLPACEDYDLWLRISLHFPILFIDLPLIIKRGGHNDQLSRCTMGMDRFRIIALKKILDNEKLETKVKENLKKHLKEKILIYTNGCKKRGKLEEANHFLAMSQ